jgi:hypothetical protein
LGFIILLFAKYLIYLHKFILIMALKQILPTSKQKSIFYIHLVVFAIANFLMWTMYDKGATGWVYPWPAWLTAAWALAVVGHWCALWTTFEDKNYDEFMRMSDNG